MKTNLLALSVISMLALASCSKNSNAEECMQGKWVNTTNQTPVYLEIDGNNNAKYYAPNTYNLPFCVGNLAEATFQLQFQPNSNIATVKSMQKKNCYGNSFAFVEENDVLKISCFPKKLYITRNDTTIYPLDRQK